MKPSELHAAAAELEMPVTGLCSTCGRVAGDGRTEHFGHPITRLVPAPRNRAAVEWLTVAEVAAAMRVSKMTVYRLCHDGELEARRIGRMLRVPREAVNAYLDRCLL